MWARWPAMIRWALLFQILGVAHGLPEFLELSDKVVKRRDGPSSVNTPSQTSAAAAAASSPTHISFSPAEASRPLSTTTLAISYPSSSTSPSTLSPTFSSPSAASQFTNNASTLTALSSQTSSSSPNLSSNSTSSSSTYHRNLTIILSTVLGSLGLVLIILALFFLHRYRKGRKPFHRTGASPINDEEIDSWRSTILEHKKLQPSTDTGKSSVHTQRGASIESMAMRHSPGSSWNNSMHNSVPAHTNQERQRPTVQTRAPNSRAGLTDDSRAGSQPYIAPIKRQSSRLSKAAPAGHGHGRSKSRRSSITHHGSGGGSATTPDAKVRDENHYAESPLTPVSPTDEDERESGKSLDMASIFDEQQRSQEQEQAGGLSPRPDPRAMLRPWERVE